MVECSGVGRLLCRSDDSRTCKSFLACTVSWLDYKQLCLSAQCKMQPLFRRLYSLYRLCTSSSSAFTLGSKSLDESSHLLAHCVQV